jgi:hypothetical protein
MKVKCKKISDKENEVFSQISDGWLTINKNYNVLTITIDLDDFNDSSVQIEPDNLLHPIIEKLSNFELVDHKILENFGFYIDLEKKYIKIEPQSWHEYKSTREEWADFWEDFFDHERAAIELYRKEVAFIKGESYQPLPTTKPDAKELLEIYRRRERDGLIPNQGFNKSFEPIPLTSTDDWRK